jgi:hypothetical protein
LSWKCFLCCAGGNVMNGHCSLKSCENIVEFKYTETAFYRIWKLNKQPGWSVMDAPSQRVWGLTETHPQPVFWWLSSQPDWSEMDIFWSVMDVLSSMMTVKNIVTTCVLVISVSQVDQWWIYCLSCMVTLRYLVTASVLGWSEMDLPVS